MINYLHLIVPLVYLFAAAIVVWIVQIVTDEQQLMIKEWSLIKRPKRDGVYEKQAARAVLLTRKKLMDFN